MSTKQKEQRGGGRETLGKEAEKQEGNYIERQN